MFRKAPAAPVDPPAPSSAKRRDDPLTEAQREFLAQTGCEQYQGFLFAPALASAGFEALLPDCEPLDT